MQRNIKNIFESSKLKIIFQQEGDTELLIVLMQKYLVSIN